MTGCLRNCLGGATKMKSFKTRKINDAAITRRPKIVPDKTERLEKASPSASESGSSDSEVHSDDEIDEKAMFPEGRSNAHNGTASSETSSTGEAEQTTTEAPNTSDQVTKTFADLGVREELVDACTALKYKHPTPIQVEAIPLALQGRDVIGLAETGSGKTAAFVLPILQALLEKQQALFGLILAPTRELAYQIAQQVDALGSIINVKSAILVGGMDMVPQAIALSKRPHIVVATPGRHKWR